MIFSSCVYSYSEIHRVRSSCTRTQRSVNVTMSVYFAKSQFKQSILVKLKREKDEFCSIAPEISNEQSKTYAT